MWVEARLRGRSVYILPIIPVTPQNCGWTQFKLTGKTSSCKGTYFDASDIVWRMLMDVLMSAVVSLESESLTEVLLKIPLNIPKAISWVAPSPIRKF